MRLRGRARATPAQRVLTARARGVGTRGVAALLEKLENQTDKTSNNLSGITSKIMDISKKENQLKSRGRVPC